MYVYKVDSAVNMLAVKANKLNTILQLLGKWIIWIQDIFLWQMIVMDKNITNNITLTDFTRVEFTHSDTAGGCDMHHYSFMTCQ